MATDIILDDGAAGFSASSGFADTQVDNSDAGYVEAGSGWLNSGLGGVNGGSRYSFNTGATASYTFQNVPAGSVTLQINTPGHSNSAIARYTVNGSEFSFDQRNATNGWATLGNVTSSGGTVVVTVSRSASSGGDKCLRTDAIRLQGDGWTTSSLGGNDGDSLYAYSNAATAMYSFSGLTAGSYEVLVNTPGHSNSTAAAVHTVTSGGQTLASYTVDQRPGTGGWQSLGVVNVTASNLAVTVSKNSGGVLRADAVRIRGANPPEAVNDTYSVDEDTSLIVRAVGVLANDSDDDGDPLTAVLSNNPSHGAVSLNPNGSFTYIPAANYFGTDSFAYTISDGTFTSSPATVALTINPVNDAPVVFDDSLSVLEDVETLVDIVNNDSDIDGPSLTVEIVSPPVHGTISINGSFVSFTPAPFYVGPDVFTYRLNDGATENNTSMVALVALDISAVNHAPRDIVLTPAQNARDEKGNPRVPENEASPFVVGDLSIYDWDGAPLNNNTLSLVDTSFGLFEIVGNTLRTTESLDFETATEHTIIVRATDVLESELSVDKTFVIKVKDVNEFAPQVNDATFEIKSDIPNGGTVGQVVATDADRLSELTFSIISGDTYETFAIDQRTGGITVRNGGSHLTPNLAYVLTVKVSDGNSSWDDTGEITINIVSGGFVAPDAVDDNGPDYKFAYGDSVVLTQKTIRNNDGSYTTQDSRIIGNDSFSTNFRTELVGAPPPATTVTRFNLSSDGVVYFDIPEKTATSPASFSFQYKLIEPTATGFAEDTATVTIEFEDPDVEAVDDAFFAEYLGGEAVPKNIKTISFPAATLKLNDLFPAGSANFQIELTSQPKYGSLRQTAVGFEYVPRPNWMDVAKFQAADGTSWIEDHFTYRLKNGAEVSEEATVEILPPKNYECGTDPSTDAPGPGDGGRALVGGGNDDGMVGWLIDQANGGDIVILKAAGSSVGYPLGICSAVPPPNSVKMFIVDSQAAADSDDVKTAIENAEAVYIGGGAQDDYLNFWSGTKVGNALEALPVTTAIAGTSAGMAILGPVDYSAVNGSANSFTAIRNPYDATITFDSSFLDKAGSLNETHFYERDRMGRALVFAARESRLVIASDESAAYIPDGMGGGTVLNVSDKPNVERFVYLIEADCCVAPGESMIGKIFDITRKSSEGASFSYTLTVGSNFDLISSAVENGVSLVYGPDRLNH